MYGIDNPEEGKGKPLVYIFPVYHDSQRDFRMPLEETILKIQLTPETFGDEKRKVIQRGKYLDGMSA